MQNNIAEIINNYIDNGLYVTHVNFKENDQGSKSLHFPKNWLNNLVKNNVEEWYGKDSQRYKESLNQKN